MLNASIYSGHMNLCDRDKLRQPSQCLLSSLEGSWHKNLRNWFLARNEFIAWTEYLIYILQKFLIHSERKRNHYLDVIFHPGQSESKSKIAINQIFLGGKRFEDQFLNICIHRNKHIEPKHFCFCIFHKGTLFA